MAQRRMFSPDIVHSDAFLEMPPSTQALYFQLGMKADDDGFVNPRMVMRMMGSSDDELKVLVTKRFVLPFENGVIVIKHWRINNLVRKDWYKPTIYTEQKDTLFLKENGSYTDDPNGGIPVNKHLVNEPLTQVRLGKYINTSEAKLRVESVESENADTGRVKGKPKYPHSKEVFGWFPKPQKSWAINSTELKHAELLWERGEKQVKAAIRLANEHRDDSYCPEVSKPSQLEQKWSSLYRYATKNGLV